VVMRRSWHEHAGAGHLHYSLFVKNKKTEQFRTSRKESPTYFPRRSAKYDVRMKARSYGQRRHHPVSASKLTDPAYHFAF